MKKLPCEMTAITDTREQLPVFFKHIPTITRGLKCGDYSIIVDGTSLEDKIAVERKSLDDFLNCCGSQRERFERCIDRMLPFSSKAIIVEATLHQLLSGEWRSRISVNSVIGSYLRWQEQGIPIILAGDRAHDFVEWWLILAGKKWYLNQCSKDKT